MSDRSYVWIIENNTGQFYPNSWGAPMFDQYLFWGEDFNIKLAHSLGLMDYYVDLTWEAGALIDRDQKQLLWWQKYYFWDYPNAYQWLNALIEINWPGWEVRYVPGEDFDLQNHVARRLSQKVYPISSYDCQHPSPASVLKMAPPEQFLLSVYGANNNTLHYALNGLYSQFLCAGPDVLTLLNEAKPVDRVVPYDVNHPYNDLLFINIPQKELWIYEAYAMGWQATLNHIRQHWPGWKVQYHFGWLVEHCRLSGLDHNKLFWFYENYWSELIGRLSLTDSDELFKDLQASFLSKIPSGVPHAIPVSWKKRLTLAQDVLAHWQSKEGGLDQSLQNDCVWKE
jgi:hypothetical protein